MITIMRIAKDKYNEQASPSANGISNKSMIYCNSCSTTEVVTNLAVSGEKKLLAGFLTLRYYSPLIETNKS